MYFSKKLKRDLFFILYPKSQMSNNNTPHSLFRRNLQNKIDTFSDPEENTPTSYYDVTPLKLYRSRKQRMVEEQDKMMKSELPQKPISLVIEEQDTIEEEDSSIRLPSKRDILKDVSINYAEIQKTKYPLHRELFKIKHQSNNYLFGDIGLTNYMNVYSLSRKELEANVKMITNKNLELYTNGELREYLVNAGKRDHYVVYYFGEVTKRTKVNDWKDNYYRNSPAFREYYEYKLQNEY